MEVVHERCCGLDIHKKLIVACAVTTGNGGLPRRHVRTFGTMTDELQQLSGWRIPLADRPRRLDHHSDPSSRNFANAAVCKFRQE